jgi:hypothetical protein
MNIFALDPDPIQAAIYNCDVHCNKMFLELTQCLTNCFPLSELPNMPLTVKGTVRKYSHYNHPSAKWIRANTSNLEWTIEHTKQLEMERLIRNMNPHFTSETFQWIRDNRSKMIDIPNGPLNEFAIAISADKQCRQRITTFDSKSSVDKYRLFYIFDKPFAEWTVRPIPTWFTDLKKQYHLDN